MIFRVVVVVVVAADAFVCLSTEAHLLARRKQKKNTNLLTCSNSERLLLPYNFEIDDTSDMEL